ncbi:hypothetical protein TNCV_5024411 [Trichonephila clavipes]|nr:hypothetical protein TNCV_5024411 [Trichonephila clavipes]
MVVKGSRVFSLTCPLGSLRPELMAALFQPNPRSEIMHTPSSSVNPTPLDHADNQRNVHPKGISHGRRLVRGHETTPLKMKGYIEDGVQ